MYKMKKSAFFAASVCAVAAAMTPSICMTSPLGVISAGQRITASIDNPQGRPCVATLLFSDDNFLPVTYKLDPIACLGYQSAGVDIPIEVPNGDVTVLWQCSGENIQGCSRATIIGGTGNVDALVLQQTGTIECFVLTTTLTTLVTSTQLSTTMVDIILTTLFSTSMESMASLTSDLSVGSSVATHITFGGMDTSTSLDPAATGDIGASRVTSFVTSYEFTDATSAHTQASGGQSGPSTEVTTMGPLQTLLESSTMGVTSQCPCSSSTSATPQKSGSPL